MTHFTDRELQDWAEQPPAAPDRARVTEHIAACAACASRYATAIRQRTQSPETVDEDDVRRFAEAAYVIPPVNRPGLRPRPWTVGLAAAAVLALAIVIPYSLRRAHDAAPPPQFRGAAVHALAPVGTVAPGTEFAWASDAANVSFRLEIGDATRTIETETATTSPLRLSPAGWARLSPGIDYWWRVTAIDASGREIATSPRQVFRLQAR